MIEHTSNPLPRRLRSLVAAGLAASLLALAPTSSAPASQTGAPTRADAAAAPGADGSDGVEPASAARGVGAGKPRRVCDTALLDGPATKPKGAKRVRITQNLQQVTNASPSGTTFWLDPGVHTLPGGAYDQVQPKEGNTYIGAPGAVLDGRGVNRYAFSSYAEHVTVSYLTIQNFGQGIDDNAGEGVVNHAAGDHWFIHHNTVQDNAGAGVFMGNGTRVVKNCLRDNGEYGFESYEIDAAVRNVVLRGNEITGNNTADWESIQPGCGCSGGGKFWDTRGAKVVNNYVHHNHGVGLWADTNNVGFLFEGNYISDNEDVGIFYEISYNALIRRNTFARNDWKAAREDGNGNGAIYLSEAGSDPRAGELYGRHLRISGNLFVDNWAGIRAWESPARFVGSPFQTSTGYTTLVNPGVATVANCSDPDLLAQAPYIDDCRWKTQHLRVVNNRFVFDPTHIPGCTPALECGFMFLVSNYGDVPEWMPYQAYFVPNNIALHQDNIWRNNAYEGPWRFAIRILGSGELPWSKWRAAPYHQDAGSTKE